MCNHIAVLFIVGIQSVDAPFKKVSVDKRGNELLLGFDDADKFVAIEISVNGAYQCPSDFL